MANKIHQIDNEYFKIRKISIRTLKQVKAVTPFQDATMGPFASYGITILTIEDQDGNIGEAPVFRSYTDILETCLFPIIFNNPTVKYGELYPQLYWAIRNEGFKGAASSLLGQLDIALHDLDARRKNVPLYKYIGGSNNAVNMYGSGGGTNYTYEELENEIKIFTEAGVTCYKMKIGKDFGSKIEEDVKRVKFVKQLLSPGIKLAVDANQIWTCDDVFKFLDGVGEEDLEWLEEPIHSASYDQIAKLAGKTSVPLAYGESERTSKIFPTLVNSGVRHLQPVPAHLSGIREWMEVRDLANQHGLALSSGGYSLYSSFLMTSAPQDSRVEYLYSILYGLEKYFLIYPAWKNGKFILPDISGLPVRINWDFCSKEIINEKIWHKNDVPKYKPVVSI